MTDLIEVKTADLDGEALGWAVGKAEGLDLILEPPQYGNPWRVFARYQGHATERTKRYNPCEDWVHGGPLFDKYDLLMGSELGKPLAIVRVITDRGVRSRQATGPTKLIAACRTIVAAKIGDTVQVPKELMP